MRNSVKSGLAALVIGSSLLSNKVQATEWGVEFTSTGTRIVHPEGSSTPMDLQDILNGGNLEYNIQSGDTLNFTGDYGFVIGDFNTTNKAYTINANGKEINGSLTLYGNSNLSISNLFLDGATNLLDARDSSSLSISTSYFSNGGNGNSVYFNSTGNLDVSDSLFNESSGSSIYVEKIAGNVNILRNEIFKGSKGIYLGPEDIASGSIGDAESVLPTLNIVNNTIHEFSDVAIEISSPLLNTSGNIANNSISNGDEGIRGIGNLGSLSSESNNVYNEPISVLQVYTRDISSGTNYTFFPDYVDPNSSDPNLNLNVTSALWNRGADIPGVTSWFTNGNTWIGKYGSPFESGDSDLDGDIDLSDLGNLATNYGMPNGATWNMGDFDRDGDVDLNDLGTLATNYGAGSAQAYADFNSLVPEPSALGIAGLGAAYLASKRRRN